MKATARWDFLDENETKHDVIRSISLPDRYNISQTHISQQKD